MDKTKKRYNNKEQTPVYEYSLKYALNNVPEGDWIEIILNHKFAIYKGFKKTMRKHRYWKLIKDFNDLMIEYYDYKKAAIPEWKLYINDSLLEQLVLDAENEWYDAHNIYLTKNDILGGGF